MPPVPRVPAKPPAAPSTTSAPATSPAAPSTTNSGPVEPPANKGAAVGRKLDNAGRKAGQKAAKVGKSAAKAPVFSRAQRASITGGSIAVGLIAYAVGVAYLQHGWPGVGAWLKAKLFNETTQGSAAVPAMLFHTGPGAGGGGVMTAGTQVTATAPPAAPAAPTPSGGILYA